MRFFAPLQFLFYFIRFRLAVFLGIHSTAFPTDIAWQWQHWERLQRNRGSHYRR